jgi:hypothetical protein
MTSRPVAHGVFSLAYPSGRAQICIQSELLWLYVPLSTLRGDGHIMADSPWAKRHPDRDQGVRLGARCEQPRHHLRETCVRLAQKTQVGPCIPVGIQL